MSKKLSRQVAILGSGPAGIMAAHAAFRFGFQPIIISATPDPSTLHGCQYLHKNIPGVLTSNAVIEYQVHGTSDQYREKVYGAGWDGVVSPNLYRGLATAWDLREVYQRLFIRYTSTGNFIQKTVDKRFLLESLPEVRSKFAAIISTIPAKILCMHPGRHTFDSQPIYAIGERAGGPESPVGPSKDNTVICDGTKDVSWYRTGRVFGVGTTEWPAIDMRKPPVEGVVKVEKPLSTNCDCFRDIHRLGRYGSWRKSVLVHDVFEQMQFICSVLKGNACVANRRDLCHRCGMVACAERFSVELNAVEYNCLSGHYWDDKKKGTTRW